MGLPPSGEFWQPVLLSMRLAAVTTAALAVAGIPLAYWLAYARGRWRDAVHACVSLPLVLPPTVLGFYLLVLLSPAGGLGGWLDRVLGLRLVFSFTGLVLGSMIYSLPFMVHPVEAALAALPPSLREASYMLGKSPRETFWRVLLPNIRPALGAAGVMTFAHTLGEFGVVLMVGGSVPGETRVASIAIFSEVEALNYGVAHAYALVLLACTFPVLLGLERWRSASSSRA
ncbi:MAG: molybdate ABC transporter permease subunit [Elusimicrobia bacterium]|nr:molybdate ABC transporter permease subunit [Elusimicrobiota bacterium]